MSVRFKRSSDKLRKNTCTICKIQCQGGQILKASVKSPAKAGVFCANTCTSEVRLNYERKKSIIQKFSRSEIFCCYRVVFTNAKRRFFSSSYICVLIFFFYCHLTCFITKIDTVGNQVYAFLQIHHVIGFDRI